MTPDAAPASLGAALARILPLLRCPDDGGALQLSEPKFQSPDAPNAELICASCGRSFPCLGGIMYLLPRGYEQRIRAEVKEFYENHGWTRREGRYEDTRAFTSSAEALRPLQRARGQRIYAPAEALTGEWFADIGCGANPALAAGKGFRFHVCIDFAAAALRECQAKLGERGLYILADAARLPLAPGSVGFVHAAHCLYHIGAEEQPAALRGWFEALAPGGRALVQYASPFAPSYIASLHWLEFAAPPLHRLLCALRDGITRLLHPGWKKPEHTLYFRPLPLARLRAGLPAAAGFRAEVFALFDDRNLACLARWLPGASVWLAWIAALESACRFSLAPFARHVSIHLERRL